MATALSYNQFLPFDIMSMKHERFFDDEVPQNSLEAFTFPCSLPPILSLNFGTQISSNNKQTAPSQQLPTTIQTSNYGTNVSLNTFSTNVPQTTNFLIVAPNQSSQFYQQAYSQLLRTPSLEGVDKKKRTQRPLPRRVRQTRPKVVEAKGAVQCKGKNRKKGAQCRNAALMEYIGPRPIYCAEHIELDPKSLYEKCKSPYQKEQGDGKGCKEVVLKEFGFCYKHFGDYIADIITKGDWNKLTVMLDRVAELLTQLEKEAVAAKKKDGDLYQRKNKLIPKFQEMKKVIMRALETRGRVDLLIADSVPAIEISPHELPPLGLGDISVEFKPLNEDALHSALSHVESFTENQLIAADVPLFPVENAMLCL